MKFRGIFTISVGFSVGIFSLTASAQSETTKRLQAATENKTPVIQIAPNAKNETVSRERREQAYLKLLEAQRHLWAISRVRSQTAAVNNIKLARTALDEAVKLNPNLSEAYTALAEIAVSPPYSNIEEGIVYAENGIRSNKDNFGAHRVLARLYTIKSSLNTGILNPDFARKAIQEWKEVTRLDPRNAEGWAFLSDLYGRTKQNDERIKALRNWTASAQALDSRFYRSIIGSQETLSPETANVKLGAALLDAGKFSEAITILNRAISEDPENELIIDLLRQAILRVEGNLPASTIEALQQAAFANQTNLSLVTLLAETQVRMGKSDDAITTIKKSIATSNADKNGIANLHIALGDIYTNSKRSNEAISSYEDALQAFGIEKADLTTDDEREFATRVFEKMINTYKSAGRINEAKATIQRARLLLGKSDLFADKQLVTLLRQSGNKTEALASVRSLRALNPEDYSLLRLEAEILTELGKVEEGVGMIRKLITVAPAKTPSPYYDNFSNYLFISGLYTKANRPKDAILNAQKAFQSTKNEELKQIASLTLASIYHQSGDFKTAEDTLRDLLKRNPTNPIALNNLGFFLLERNINLAEAHNLIEEAVKIDPTNSSYLDSLGWAKFKLGKYSESEKFLKEALRYNPASATVYEHLGDVYQKLGKFEEAREAWEKALSLEPQNESLSRIRAKIESK